MPFATLNPKALESIGRATSSCGTLLPEGAHETPGGRGAASPAERQGGGVAILTEMNDGVPGSRLRTPDGLPRQLHLLCVFSDVPSRLPHQATASLAPLRTASVKTSPTGNISLYAYPGLGDKEIQRAVLRNKDNTETLLIFCEI